jgi:malonyl-CoA/methylmalonyl-CoA synthetase
MEQWMTGHNLYSVFTRHFPDNRQRVAIETAAGRNISFAELESASARMAKLLVGLGLQAGDRVTVQIEKSPEGVFLYLACLRAGLVYHPLNTAYQRGELDYFLGNAEPTAIICSSSYYEVMGELADVHGIDHVLTLEADGSGSLTEHSAAHDEHFTTVPRTDEDMAALLYSSGTTGHPKGIMLSHGNLAANALTLVDAWGFTAQDVLLHALPIFHVHGLFVAINCALLSGCKMIYLPSYEPQQVMQHLPDSTVMMGVPTYYTRLLAAETFGRDMCTNMRLFISGSAPLVRTAHRSYYSRALWHVGNQYEHLQSSDGRTQGGNCRAPIARRERAHCGCWRHCPTGGRNGRLTG